MRLFFGLSPSDEARLSVSALSRRAEALNPGRYTIPQNYHITLAFLGDVPQARLHDAQEALERCVSRFPAPYVAPGRLDYFGRAQNGILILRCESDPDLAPLHEALTKELQARSLPFDSGPFAPHITLARHARIEEDALRALSCSVPAFTCARAYLYLSARDESGVLRYTPLSGAAFLPPLHG